MSWELPDRISVREVGPRDGLQNEDPVPTDAKVALLDRLSATGVQRIEAVSFVRPSAIPQMADADEVWKRAARAPSVRYSALVPNLRGAGRALDAGFTELEAVVSASETHNRKNVNRSTGQSLDEIAEIIAVAHDRGATAQVRDQRGVPDRRRTLDPLPHRVRVGHLRYRLGPHERHRLDPLHARRRQPVDQLDLRLGGHRILVLQPVPRADLAHRDPLRKITHCFVPS